MKKEMPQKGFTLIETILVLVIIATAAGLAAPSISRGIENREAKQALETLGSIRHAVRMFQQDHGSLPVPVGADTLKQLVDSGYLNDTEFAIKQKNANDSRGYIYAFQNPSPTAGWCVRAVRVSQGGSCLNSSQTLRAIQLSRDGVFSDSVGFLAPNNPGLC